MKTFKRNLKEYSQKATEKQPQKTISKWLKEFHQPKPSWKRMKEKNRV
jgi:hypothetical protein